MMSLRVNRCLILAVSIGLISSCSTGKIEADSHVQSEMIYLADRAPLQTCWVSSPNLGGFGLNRYFFYFYEQPNEGPCHEALPADQAYYAFNRQLQPELAIHVIEDLLAWQATDPDLSFLDALPACRSRERSLGVDLISFPAISRASEVYVDFSIQCSGPVDGATARIGFSYDHQVSTLTAEDETLILR